MRLISFYIISSLLFLIQAAEAHVCTVAVSRAAGSSVDRHLPRPEIDLILKLAAPNSLFIEDASHQTRLFFTAEAPLSELDPPVGLKSGNILVRDAAKNLYVIDNQGRLLNKYRPRLRQGVGGISIQIIDYQVLGNATEALLIEVTETNKEHEHYPGAEGDERTRYELLHIKRENTKARIARIAEFGATDDTRFADIGDLNEWRQIGIPRGSIQYIAKLKDVVVIAFEQSLMALDMKTGKTSEPVKAARDEQRIVFTGGQKGDRLRITIAKEGHVSQHDERWDQMIQVSHRRGVLSINVSPKKIRPAQY